MANRSSELRAPNSELLVAWTFTHALGKICDEPEPEQLSRSWVDEWRLGRILAESFRELGQDEGAAARAVSVVKLLTAHARWHEALPSQDQPACATLETWLRDEEVQQFLQVNRHQGILWFNHESFQQLLAWMLLAALVSVSAGLDPTGAEKSEALARAFAVIRDLRRAEQASGYQVDALLSAAR
jgi:hypothetical protein